ncbi:cytochrome d ubiquinol oxidase subunit II [Salmonella enterica]|uniref:Cytochrome d ubiquinol oxidase subunit II n=1 Tax=Salmonella enterica TaxID=28901 RepID=A0A3J8WZ01_SALER|nr:cytochrome d ubiquinol oxidase subunit II [Salmonella enterica subsp. enterica serovar Oranienburg]EAX0788485.1 cytochrome d ubiquinol oxidase subunit II [Salmonella enterica]OIV01825.1 cytochrome d ubiquinol oxidase subunit II [Salmonella enterica subsp. houtenae]EAX0792490.1 cytochrome d ubiquinol oxidase subunit II [Salmonella enterica]EBI8449413.1 cytochrome d ubiquinol oxidase subunit II [Salmonella enterica]
MGMDLSVIWFVIIVFATLMYIVMDGFDLGIGILFPMVQNADDRDVMVNSVAPVWDGNETWLVLGGAGLFGAFPLAYAVIIDALTIPLTLMLIGLIFRGVAFEFRFKATPTHRPFWDKAFLFGSLLATFTQGIVVGAVINGFTVTGRAYSGGPFDWFTPFTLFCGMGLVVAYALLGATWLVMKSENPLQDKMCNLAKKLLIALLLTITIISLWTPLTHHAIAERWFTLPNLWFLLPVPLFVALFSLGAWRSLNQQHYHALPFVLTLGLIFLGFSGLGISIWPHIIPPSITLWQAAAPTQSQGFMLVGTLLIIPIILVYTFWSYYVFRGKVQHGEGYH